MVGSYYITESQQTPGPMFSTNVWTTERINPVTSGVRDPQMQTQLMDIKKKLQEVQHRCKNYRDQVCLLKKNREDQRQNVINISDPPKKINPHFAPDRTSTPFPFYDPNKSQKYVVNESYYQPPKSPKQKVIKPSLEKIDPILVPPPTSRHRGYHISEAIQCGLPQCEFETQPFKKDETICEIKQDSQGTNTIEITCSPNINSKESASIAKVINNIIKGILGKGKHKNPPSIIVEEVHSKKSAPSMEYKKKSTNGLFGQEGQPPPMQVYYDTKNDIMSRYDQEKYDGNSSEVSKYEESPMYDERHYEGRKYEVVTKYEGTKYEGSEWEGLKYEGSKYEGSKYEGSKYERSKHEGSKFEGSKYEGSKHDGSKYEGPKYEGSKYEGSKYEGSKYDASKHEGSIYEGLKYELVPKYEGSTYEGSNYERSNYERSKYEVMAKHEGAKYEDPNFELPKYQPPKHEQPKYIIPNYETNKYNQLKSRPPPQKRSPKTRSIGVEVINVDPPDPSKLSSQSYPKSILVNKDHKVRAPHRENSARRDQQQQQMYTNQEELYRDNPPNDDHPQNKGQCARECPLCGRIKQRLVHSSRHRPQTKEPPCFKETNYTVCQQAQSTNPGIKITKIQKVGPQVSTSNIRPKNIEGLQDTYKNICDPSVIHQLSEDIGDPDVVSEILEQLISITQKEIKKLEYRLSDEHSRRGDVTNSKGNRITMRINHHSGHQVNPYPHANHIEWDNQNLTELYLNDFMPDETNSDVVLYLDDLAYNY